MASAGESDEQARAREAGADDFLTKPFNRQTVLAKLERLGVAVGATP